LTETRRDPMALAFSAGFGQAGSSQDRAPLSSSSQVLTSTPHALSAGPVSAAGAWVAAAAVMMVVRGRRRARVQRKGWGDDVTFHDASVVSNVEAA